MTHNELKLRHMARRAFNKATKLQRKLRKVEEAHNYNRVESIDSKGRKLGSLDFIFD